MNHKHYRRMLADTLEEISSSGEMDKAIKSPSKHIPLDRLKQIKQDHSVGEGGQEYSEEEVSQAISDREVSRANRMVQQAKRDEKRMAEEAEGGGGFTPDKLPSWMHTKPKLKMSKSSAKEMKKTRGRLAFNKLPKVTSRPDQEIQGATTRRQTDLLGRKVANQLIRTHYKGLTPRDQQSYRDSFTRQVSEAAFSPHQEEKISQVQNHMKNKYDVDIPKDFLETHGRVISTPAGRPFGAVANEGAYPTGQRREHEAIHYLLSDIEHKYGKETRDHAEKGASSLIHPEVAGHLKTYLKFAGYGDAPEESEKITHLYEMLHDPRLRDMMRKVSPEFAANERDLMGHAKKSWNAIRAFASGMEKVK